MKRFVKLMGVTLIFAILTSCIVHSHPGRRGAAPPGQVKKVCMQKKVMDMDITNTNRIITNIEDKKQASDRDAFYILREKTKKKNFWHLA